MSNSESFEDELVNYVLTMTSNNDCVWIREKPFYNDVYCFLPDEAIHFSLGNIESSNIDTVEEARYMFANRRNLRYHWAWKIDEVHNEQIIDLFKQIFSSPLDPIMFSNEMDRIKKIIK